MKLPDLIEKPEPANESMTITTKFATVIVITSFVSITSTLVSMITNIEKL